MTDKEVDAFLELLRSKDLSKIRKDIALMRPNETKSSLATHFLGTMERRENRMTARCTRSTARVLAIATAAIFVAVIAVYT